MSAAKQMPRNAVKIEGAVIDPASIPSALVKSEYDRRFGGGGPAFDAETITMVYRLIAENRNTEAMEEMAREFPYLAPPTHELKVADLLSYSKV